VLKDGEAIRIMTGARVPEGADAIQKIELTSESGDVVMIEEATTKSKYIVRKGAEIKKGARLFRPGEVIDERMIASLAAFGYPEVQVSYAPRVSILGTGSEIVAVEKQPGEDQIRNSNSVMLKAMCERVGAIAKVLPQTGDDLEKLKKAISKAVGLKSQIPNPTSQILVITGGRLGRKIRSDEGRISELGAEIYFQKSDCARESRRSLHV
jgi:molybdopterin molybdotransferase